MTTDPKILKLIYNIRLADMSKSKYEIEEELRRAGIRISRKVIQKVINRHIELQNTQHQRKLGASRKLKIARIKAARELREKEVGSLIQVDTQYFLCLNRPYSFAPKGSRPYLVRLNYDSFLFRYQPIPRNNIFVVDARDYHYCKGKDLGMDLFNCNFESFKFWSIFGEI